MGSEDRKKPGRPALGVTRLDIDKPIGGGGSLVALDVPEDTVACQAMVRGCDHSLRIVESQLRPGGLLHVRVKGTGTAPGFVVLCYRER